MGRNPHGPLELGLDSASPTGSSHRVLVFRYGQLGDTLVSLPSLWAIREHFPDSHISWLSESTDGTTWIGPKDILPGPPVINAFHSYKIPAGKAARIYHALQLLYWLRRSRFDVLVYLAPRLRTDPRRAERDRQFFRLTGIPSIMGFTGVEFLSPECPIRPLPRVRNEALSLLDRLAASGVHPREPDKLRGDLAITSAEFSEAQAWFDRELPDYHRADCVAIGPGSKMPAKRWPLERFEELGHWLISHHKLCPVIFGGPEDREIGQRLVSSWGMGAVAAGSLSVRVAAGAMTGMRFYVGNDTGTMHLAASAGLRCVGIFAAIEYPGKWDPFGEGHVILREHPECEGCRLQVCPKDNACLQAISVSQVIQACQELCDQR